MTEEEKKALEAQKEKERLEAEAAAAKKKDDEGGSDKTYTEDYVKGIRGEAAKYRTKLRELEERLGKLDSVDVEEYKRLKDEQAAAERKKLEEKGEFDKIKDQLTQGHSKELGKKDTEIAGLKARIATLEVELHNTILDNSITVEAAAAKCLNPTLLTLWLKNEAKVETTEEGRKIIKLVDSTGSAKYNSKGDPMSVKDRIAEMKQDEAFAMLFEGGIQGAGSGTKNGSGGRLKNPWKAETFNLTEQGKLVKDNPDLAKRLAAEAGVTLAF